MKVQRTREGGREQKRKKGRERVKEREGEIKDGVIPRKRER